MEKFTIGLVLGGVIGAVLVANNCKMRAVVRKSQEDIKCRLDELLDEKLQDMKEGARRAKTAVENAVEDGVENVKARVCHDKPCDK